jgi:hypothetical protein
MCIPTCNPGIGRFWKFSLVDIKLYVVSVIKIQDRAIVQQSLFWGAGDLTKHLILKSSSLIGSIDAALSINSHRHGQGLPSAEQADQGLLGEESPPSPLKGLCERPQPGNSDRPSVFPRDDNPPASRVSGRGSRERN